MSAINGAHFLIYSREPEADRAFLRDIFGFGSVDAGGGWSIFKLPPSEIAVHPSEGDFAQDHGGHEMLGIVLYLMCDDVHSMVKTLEARKVPCAAVETAPWGLFTVLRLPSGGSIGLYQPTHPTATGLP